MLINLTNHPSQGWMEDQKQSAKSLYGEVIDLPFPAVPTSAGPDEIVSMADKAIADIFRLKENDAGKKDAWDRAFAVMVQGEFTLTYAIVSRLKAAGIKAVSAVSERIVCEQVEDGVIKKTAIFRFAGFREYI